MLVELELGLLGLELEPEAALPDGLLLELELGLLLELAPPLAWSFFESVDIDAEPEVELEGEAVDELGDDGEVVEPAEEELEPDGEVVVPREAARSPVLSHAVTNAVPRATEMASAIGVSLMYSSKVGVQNKAARFGPTFPGVRTYFPSVLKSLCCAPCFGSTWPCTGFCSAFPEFTDDGVGDAGAALEPDAGEAGVDVLGRCSPRSHAVSKARENAATAIVTNFITSLHE